MTENQGAEKRTESYTKMTAEIYDAIYSFKDYAYEAKQLEKLIDRFKETDGSDLLDVACGTGAHLTYLKDRFHVTGIDLSQEQLAEARKRLPDTEFIEADMRDFDLGKQFDVVTCLFSSIGYSLTAEGLNKSVATMSRHLKPGGVLIIEPWLSKEKYDPNHHSPPDTGILPDGTTVVRTANNSVEGNVSVLVMSHELDGPMGHSEFVEEHRLAMYTANEFREAFHSAGLNCEFIPQGLQVDNYTSRGIYVGVKLKQK